MLNITRAFSDSTCHHSVSPADNEVVAGASGLRSKISQNGWFFGFAENKVCLRINDKTPFRIVAGMTPVRIKNPLYAHKSFSDCLFH